MAWVSSGSGLALIGGGAGAIAYGSSLRFPSNNLELANQLRNRQTLTYIIGGVVTSAGVACLAAGIVRFVVRSRRSTTVGFAPEAAGGTVFAAGTW